MNRGQTEDLKAFEQRLIECVCFTKTRTRKWRIILVATLIWLLVSLWIWWTDSTQYNGYVEMFLANKSLTLSFTVFFFLYIFGILEKNNATQILTSRCRTTLQDFNMSCDDQGKLILKKKPTYEIRKPVYDGRIPTTGNAPYFGDIFH